MDRDAARDMDDQYDAEEALGVAYRRFVNELADTRDDTDVGVVEATAIAIAEVRDLRETVAEQQATIQELRGRVATLTAIRDTKRQKVRDILEYALGGASGADRGVVLSAKEVQRAADVSPSYAYRLMDGDDGLPSEFPYFLTRKQAAQRSYGSLELDTSEQTKGLVVDIDAVQSDPTQLTLFNNGGRGEVGE